MREIENRGREREMRERERELRKIEKRRVRKRDSENRNEFHKKFYRCFLKEIEKCLENYEAAAIAFTKYVGFFF